MFPLLTIDLAQTLIAQVSFACSNPYWIQIIVLILVILLGVIAAAIVVTTVVIVSPLVIGVSFIQTIFAILAVISHSSIGPGPLVLWALTATFTAILVPVLSIKTLLGCG